MALAEFLVLSGVEKNAIRPLYDMTESIFGASDDLSTDAILKHYAVLTDAVKKKLYAIVKFTDLSSLIKLAIISPKINVICNQHLFNDIWNERWRQSGRNPREKAIDNHLPIHEYLPQSTMSTFELLKGLYVYSQYIKHQKAQDPVKKQEAPEYLMKAALLGSFPALNALCTESLQTVVGQQKAFIYAQAAADLYWTPGYLLLAVVCLIQKDYVAALRNIIIAEKLIPHSAAQINNAYQGKTVQEIAAPIMQMLNVQSWDEAKQQLSTLANVPLSFVTSTIYNQAQIQVNKLLNSVMPVTGSQIEEQSDVVNPEVRPGMPSH